MLKPSILDRLVLFRHKILNVENLSRQLRVVRTEGNDVALVLRFTHPGSAMYYKLDRSEAQALRIRPVKPPISALIGSGVLFVSLFRAPV